MARFFAHPRTADLKLSRVMHALSDDVRLQLVRVLADGAYHPCREEEFAVGVHKSTLSHHFRVLREAGVTITRLDGRNHHVRLRREDLDERFPGLVDTVVRALLAEDAADQPVLAGAERPA